MKKLLMLPVLLCTMLCTTNSFAQASGDDVKAKLVGEWKGKAGEDEIVFNFTESGFVSMTNQGQTIGGESFELQEGMVASMKYEVDATQSPLWLDMVILLKEPAMEAGRMKGIARFLTDSKMEYRVQFNPQMPRPEGFGADDEDTVILEKVKM